MIKSKDGKTSWASADDMIASFLAAATPGRSKPATPATPPTPATPATPKKAEKKKRCPKGKIRNKKTGLCEKKSINTFGEKQGNWRGTSGSVPIPPKPKVNNLKKFLPDKILSFADFKANKRLERIVAEAEK